MTGPHVTPAHDQHEKHAYIVHYPDHFPRETDPHYVDFRAFHRRERGAARCYVGLRLGFDYCRNPQGKPLSIDGNGQQSGLELHHAHVEFAVQNGIDLKALEVDYPGVSNPDEVGAWVESGTNFRWLCCLHHRSTAGGAHSISHSDWEAAQYAPGLISAS